ncbi:MAG: TrmH family RNA methyltransferase [Ilumatobacteraceae bacterium]
MIEPIRVTDADDPRLADYRHLRDADIRRSMEGEVFLIAEGVAVVRRLAASGLEVRSVLLTPNRWESMRSSLSHLSCPIYVAEPDIVAGTAGFNLHRGVIASARRPDPVSLEQLLDRAPRNGSFHRLAMLEGVNDHENLGAIARAARAFDIDALVLDPTCADPYYRRSVRVSMGEVLFLPVIRSTIREVVDACATRGGESWALTPRADAHDITRISGRSSGPLALLLGAEGPGLSDESLQVATRKVRIPISADVDSLNVGHAAAVAFAFTS